MENGLFERLLEASTTIEYVAVDGEGTVVSVNPAFAAHVDRPREDLIHRSADELLRAPDVKRLAKWLRDGAPTDPVRINFVARSGSPFSLRCFLGPLEGGLRILGEPELRDDRTAAEELMRLNNELSTMAREAVRRERVLERTRKEMEATLEELQTSYWHLQKIQEVLPLCMRCGKLKTDEAHWDTVADYLKANDIFVSHGYCPACADLVLDEAGLGDDGRAASKP